MDQVEYNLHIKSKVTLTSPAEIFSLYPVTPQIKSVIENGRHQIREILNAAPTKERRLIAVCGPCSIHRVEEAIEYGKLLSKMQKEFEDRLLVVMRCYFEKPRTVVGWKGLIYDPDLNGSYDLEKGIRIARELLCNLASSGIYPGTEILDPIITQYIADMVCWAAIGARTTESQTHRQLASGLSMPVGFKNATNGNIQVAIDAIQAAMNEHTFLGVLRNGQTGIFRTTGNPDCHVILRGGFSEPNYSSEWIAYVSEKLRKAKLAQNIFVDCSHANSQKDYRKQVVVAKDIANQIKNGCNSIVGVMLESNINCGAQSITPGAELSLAKGVSITDGCIGIDETYEILKMFYEAKG